MKHNATFNIFCKNGVILFFFFSAHHFDWRGIFFNNNFSFILIGASNLALENIEQI